MQFLHPAFFALGFLALVPLALYFFRRKSKTISVSTLVFFKSLAREHQESAWLRYLKKLLSLAMTLAVIALAIFALARTVVAPAEEDLNGIVILLDRSASMAATDSDGTARLDAAKKEIRTRLDAIPESVGVALVVYDARPEVLQPLTRNRRQFLAKLEGVEIKPVADDLASAVAIAKRIAELEKPAALWHVSDDNSLAGRRILSESEHAKEREEQHRQAAKTPAEKAGTGAPAVPSDGEDGGDGGDGDVVTTPERASLDELNHSQGKGSKSGTPPDSQAANQPEARDGEGEESLLVLPDGVRLKSIHLGLAKPVNVGITSFQVRRMPRINSTSAYEAFVQVSASELAESEVEATLETTIGGRPALVPERLTLKPGEKVTRIIALDGSEGQLLRFHLECESDCFSLDNDALARLPEEKPVVVAWVTKSDDPFTQLALQSMVEDGQLDVIKDSPDNWPIQEEYDVVIFDGWIPDTLPKDKPSMVINPDRSADAVRIERLPSGVVTQEDIRVTDDRHPLLFRIAASRITLGQTSRFTNLGSLTPLWLAENEPVLAAGEVDGRRLVVMNFSPEHSEYLRLSISWPLLLGNAVFWCLDEKDTVSRTEELQSGRVVNLRGGTSLRWEFVDPSTGAVVEETIETSSSQVMQLDRIGLWSQSGLDSQAFSSSGASLLLSSRETNLGRLLKSESNPGVVATTGDLAEVESGRVDSTWLSGDLTWFLISSALALLLLESWLFHRHAVY